MTYAPGVPEEQRSFADESALAVVEAVHADRSDLHTGAPSGQPGDPDLDLKTQGRFGDLKQSLTNQWKVQDR